MKAKAPTFVAVVLALAVFLGSAPTAFGLTPASFDHALLQSMNMKTGSMDCDHMKPQANHRLPCKDSNPNCIGMLGCVAFVGLPAFGALALPDPRFAERISTLYVSSNGISPPPAYPPPIA